MVSLPALILHCFVVWSLRLKYSRQHISVEYVMLAGVNDGESPLLCFRIVLLYSLRLKYSRQRIFVEYVLLAGVNNG